MVLYVVSAVVAVTVMHVLLFVACVCAGVCFGAGVVAVSAYMGVTRGSGILSSEDDVIEMSVVRDVVGVCDMCMCLARRGVGVRGLGLCFTNPGGTGESGICVCVEVVWVVLEGSGWPAWSRVWEDGVVLSLCL